MSSATESFADITCSAFRTSTLIGYADLDVIRSKAKQISRLSLDELKYFHSSSDYWTTNYVHISQQAGGRLTTDDQDHGFLADEDSVPMVLVTGFGPFRNHTKNSSWITVQELQKLNLTDFKVVIKELPVVYDTVTEVVPLLWKEFKPKLTVHCGMCEMRTCLSIEKMARKRGYMHCDINGQIPPCNECCNDGPDVLCTAVDLSKVMDDVSSTCMSVKTETSEDAGLYLCEFIYYTSLNINRNTVFVHIPPINQPYSANEMAHTLAKIISSILKQMKS